MNAPKVFSQRLIIAVLFLIITACSAYGQDKDASSRRDDPEIKRVLGEIKAAGLPDPDGRPQFLNYLGYKAMYEEGDPKRAVKYFKWNLVLFPLLANSFQESLAEGYLQSSDVEKTIASYEKLLEITPKHVNATRFIALLKADPANLFQLQVLMKQAYSDYLDLVRRSPKRPDQD